MSETDPMFRIIPPERPRSPEVSEFFASNRELDIQRSLQFLTSQYPDTDTWVVDSGVAVQLLTGMRKQEPRDIDIVSQFDEMEEDFGHTDGLNPDDNRYIDVKSIKHWLSGRVAGTDEQEAWERILITSKLMVVGNVTVRVMHPAIITAGKSTLARMAQRPKDVADIELLHVPPEQVQAATKLLLGQQPDEQVAVLMQS